MGSILIRGKLRTLHPSSKIFGRIVICLIIIALGIGYIIGHLTKPAEMIVIRQEKDFFNTTPSVIVFKEGDMAVAINAYTKSKIAEDINHSYVIQRAIDSLPDTGGVVFIRAGVYYIYSPILIQGRTGVRLVGEGVATKLVVKGSDTIAIKIGDRTDPSKASTNIEVAHLYIDGSDQATEDQYPENYDRRFGIEVASPGNETRNIYIHDNYIYNTGSDSIYIYGSSDVYVYRNVIEGTRGYWASIHNHGVVDTDYPGYSHKSVIAFNVIRNSAVSSIRHGKVIIGNIVENSGGRSYDPYPEAITGGDNSVIAFNTVRGTKTGVSGIGTWRGENIVVGNTILNAGKHGIVVRYNLGSTTPVRGHVIYGNYIYKPAANGIFVTTGSDYTIIQANKIVKPGMSGVLFDSAGVNYCQILDNLIVDPADAYNGYNGYGVIIVGNLNTVSRNRLIVTDTSRIRPEAFIREAGGDYNIIVDNILYPGVSYRQGAILATGSNTVIKRNIGYATEASGVATLPAGSTRVTVSHGLVSAPKKVLITPLAQPPGKLWVENITSTSFDIVTDTAPSADLPVTWYAET